MNIFPTVIWGFDKKTVAVLKEMQRSVSVATSHLRGESSDAVAAEKVNNNYSSHTFHCESHCV